jgi:hypothetical protein
MGYPLNKKPKAALAQITLPTFRNTENFKDNNKNSKEKNTLLKRKWRIFLEFSGILLLFEMESSKLIKLFSRHVLKSLPMHYGIGM